MSFDDEPRGFDDDLREAYAEGVKKGEVAGRVAGIGEAADALDDCGGRLTWDMGELPAAAAARLVRALLDGGER